MAAPTPTTRVAPTGSPIRQGYEVHITFGLDPNLELWEKEYTPPGYNGGTPITTTNQFSGTRVQKSPNTAIEITDGTVVAAYDPAYKAQIRALVNRRDTITYTYPDGTTEAEYGFVQAVAFSALARDTEPTVTLTIVHSQTDWATCEAATGTITAGTGTASVC